MNNSLENNKTRNESSGIKGAFGCLCKDPGVFFAQALDGVWLSTLGASVQVSESHKRKCKDCAKLLMFGLLALSCVVLGLNGCRDTAKTSAQQTSNILSNQGR